MSILLFVLWEIYIIYAACKVIRYLLMSYESCIKWATKSYIHE